MFSKTPENRINKDKELMFKVLQDLEHIKNVTLYLEKVVTTISSNLKSLKRDIAEHGANSIRATNYRNKIEQDILKVESEINKLISYEKKDISLEKTAKKFLEKAKNELKKL